MQGHIVVLGIIFAVAILSAASSLRDVDPAERNVNPGTPVFLWSQVGRLRRGEIGHQRAWIYSNSVVPTHAVLFFHGFAGSGEEVGKRLGEKLMKGDLYGKDIMMVFPDGPISKTGDKGEGLFAWWVPVQKGNPNENDERTKIEYSRDFVKSLLVAIVEDFNIPYSHVFVGGFSQGANMALDLSVTIARDLAAAILISPQGSAYEEFWRDKLHSRKNLKALILHGKADKRVPMAQATKISNMFRANGNAVMFEEHDGEHEINDEVVDFVAEYISLAMTGKLRS